MTATDQQKPAQEGQQAQGTGSQQPTQKKGGAQFMELKTILDKLSADLRPYFRQEYEQAVSKGTIQSVPLAEELEFEGGLISNELLLWNETTVEWFNQFPLQNKLTRLRAGDVSVTFTREEAETHFTEIAKARSAALKNKPQPKPRK